MPMSNYPNGFVEGISIRGVPITLIHPGKVFWVNGSSVLAPDGLGGSNGNPGTYQKPFATIDYAVSQCKAGRGDIVMVMPGHTETISTSGGFIGLDVSGVAIIGLGKGDLRPTITLSTAASSALAASAANTTVHNLKFVAAAADITRMVNVSATDVHIDMCEFVESGADLNWVDVIDCSSTTDNNADGLTVTRCRVFGIDAACDSFIELNADIDRLTVEENFVVIDNSAAEAMIGQATGKDITNGSIQRNVYCTLKTAGDLLIDNDTAANNGVVAYNLVAHADTSGEVLFDADGMYGFENYGSGVTTASGYLLPAADS